MFRKLFFSIIIFILSSIIIGEVFYYFYFTNKASEITNTNSVSNSIPTVPSPAQVTNPTIQPVENKPTTNNRQFVNVSDAASLESGTASLTYKGKLIDLQKAKTPDSPNVEVLIISFTLLSPNEQENKITMHLTENQLAKTSIYTVENDAKTPINLTDLSIGDMIRITINSDLKNSANPIISIAIEKII